MKNSIKTYTYVIFASLALCAVSLSPAQSYPSRPIRAVVPYTPGGITDVVTRIVAQEISKAVSQNVLVDNRPGANSILGVEIVSKATPDGHTLASARVNVTGGTWVGWLAPVGAPKAAVDCLGAEIQQIFKRQDGRERFVQMGIDPVDSSPADFDKFLRAEVAKGAKVIKEAGVKVGN